MKNRKTRKKITEKVRSGSQKNFEDFFTLFFNNVSYFLIFIVKIDFTNEEHTVKKRVSKNKYNSKKRKSANNFELILSLFIKKNVSKNDSKK